MACKCGATRETRAVDAEGGMAECTIGADDVAAVQVAAFILKEYCGSVCLVRFRGHKESKGNRSTDTHRTCGGRVEGRVETSTRSFT
jgi:hypothetical protein